MAEAAEDQLINDKYSLPVSADSNYLGRAKTAKHLAEERVFIPANAQRNPIALEPDLMGDWDWRNFDTKWPAMPRRRCMFWCRDEWNADNPGSPYSVESIFQGPGFIRDFITNSIAANPTRWEVQITAQDGQRFTPDSQVQLSLGAWALQQPPVIGSPPSWGYPFDADSRYLFRFQYGPNGNVGDDLTFSAFVLFPWFDDRDDPRWWDQWYMVPWQDQFLVSMNGNTSLSETRNMGPSIVCVTGLFIDQTPIPDLYVDVRSTAEQTMNGLTNRYNNATNLFYNFDQTYFNKQWPGYYMVGGKDRLIYRFRNNNAFAFNNLSVTAKGFSLWPR